MFKVKVEFEHEGFVASPAAPVAVSCELASLPASSVSLAAHFAANLFDFEYFCCLNFAVTSALVASVLVLVCR